MTNPSSTSIIFHYTQEDAPYLSYLKSAVSGKATVFLDNTLPSTVTEIFFKARQKGVTAVVTTSKELLCLLQPLANNPSIDDYAGSLIDWKGLKFLVVDPLEQLASKPTGKFILEKFLAKILAPNSFIPMAPFTWELFSASNCEQLLHFFSICDLIAIDIETVRDDPARSIACVSYTGAKFGGSNLTLRTVVIPCDSLYNIAVIRTINKLPVAKTFQNGKYDISYFFRYNAPVTNYAFDTINLFHSWYSELPKNLGFISAFLLRDYVFHKNDGKTGDKMDYYAYNGMDTYTTLYATLALLSEIPSYVETNYLQEFPVVFPCILCEHTGIKWDGAKAADLKKQVEIKQEVELKKLRTMVACQNYNPNSPPQTARLFHLLGSKDITKTGSIARDKVANRHPLNKKILDSIESYRKDTKINGSYFKEGIEWQGRVFYSLNPHGTDTGRLASKESHFWCGLQIQNIPRDRDDGTNVKEAFVSDDGFYIGEADYSQNEARGTAYLSGDTALIEAVDDETHDFHGMNASKFFGLSYESIVNSSPVIDQEGNILEWVHKTVNKAIRDLAKRTNHGSNYNMGPQVMLDTMGIAKVLTAKKLLRLPQHYSLLDTTTHLLAVFAKTYHILKGPWYDKVKQDVVATGYLVGPTSWTRRCFADPTKSKRALNSYVAHPPQSLAAMVLNKAFLKVFNNIYLPNYKNFKLLAQIHDSLLFQYRIGYEHLAWQVAEQMRIPVEVKDTFGIRRTLNVPVDLKGNATCWADVSTLTRRKEVA